MRFRLLPAAGLVLAATLAVPAAAAAPTCSDLPKHNNFPVVDAANVTDPQKRAYLTGDLMRFNMVNDVAIVAAVVPDLGGEDVSSYAKRLFDCWGVGDADSDRGVLILAAMRERRVRVELGRGLAGEVDEAELGAAVAAMTAPMRARDVTGALRAAAEKVAEAVDAELPDLEHFVTTGQGGGLGIPPEILNPTFSPNDSIDVPDGANPFSPSPVGDASWMLKALGGFLLFAVVATIGRALLRGGLRMASGGSTWRGGFPVFGGSRSGWDDPNLLNNGSWSQGSWVGPSGGGSSGGSSIGSSGSSGGSSGSSGSGVGGGSSGGGGASGSW